MHTTCNMRPFALFSPDARANALKKRANGAYYCSLPAIIKLLDSKINEIFKKVFFVKNKKMSI